MRTVFSEDHRLQDGKSELLEGQFMKAHESPSRAEIVIERVRSARLGEVLRHQSNQRSQERFARAEKAAMQAPVRMLGPLVLCIFPCTFIVLGFPIVVKLMAGF